MSLVCFYASWRTQDHTISGPTAMTLMDAKHIVTVRRVDTKLGEHIEITDTLGRVFSVIGHDIDEWAERCRKHGSQPDHRPSRMVVYSHLRKQMERAG